ncbi:MAG TPA: AMP-dependent synthetase/ligase [Acidimicrobiales bacterium]|nr:AMP-dependent synthetase/ligase [Acidimicrobiales bacterium]
MAEITKEELDEASAGQTIPMRFVETARAHPDQVALRAKEEDGSWTEVTLAEYLDRAARAAGALERLGIGPGDRIVLMLRNCIDFHVVDMAALLRGATPVSIYNSSAPEQISYLAGHCKAKLAVAEDVGFLERFLKVKDELPHLESIAVLSDPDGVAGDEVLARADVLDGDPVDVDAALSLCTPDSLATIIYTSGTTGPPKGVMLSHRNVVWTAEGYLRLLDVEPLGFRSVSYLPMAHIAERMSTHYLGALGGYEVTTCPDPGQIAGYAREVHPEIMFGVPRVWEKIHAGVQAALSADPEKKQQFDEAVAAAAPIVERRTAGTASEEDEATYAFLDEVAFAGVRSLIGLDAVRFALTGAAPIPPELITWYRAIGVPLSEIYGMSESSGPITWEPFEVKVGTVGVAFPGVDVFLADDGEVCCRGGNVFLGYLDDPEKTAEALDPDGTLHSGDIGEFDDDGFLRIVDRKKELIITAGGKNISPANLETALKAIPIIGQACAIGDHRPFVSALVVLDPEVAPAWAKEHGIQAGSLAELAEHPDVVAEVDRAVAEVMAAFNNAERVKKVRILGEEWLPDSEELTPTSKLKRRGIHAKYADEIAALYA